MEMDKSDKRFLITSQRFCNTDFTCQFERSAEQLSKL
jgi:hypothetical protein